MDTRDDLAAVLGEIDKTLRDVLSCMLLEYDGCFTPDECMLISKLRTCVIQTRDRMLDQARRYCRHFGD